MLAACERQSAAGTTQGQDCNATSCVLVTAVSWVGALTAALRRCAAVNDNPAPSQG